MTQISNPRRRLRNFVIFWTLLTIFVGGATFAGAYAATGSVGSSEIQSENISASSNDENTENDVASVEPTATTVELAQAEPNDRVLTAQEATATALISAPQPVATATPAVTAIPVTVDGTLPADDSFEIGAVLRGFDTVDMERAWGYMEPAGMNWVKIQLRYDRGANADDFGWIVQFNHENGFKVLFGVVGEPGEIYQDGYAEEYAEFVARLAEIGADGIEVWNEVNLDREWPTGRISAADYTEFLRVSYEAIKAVNPNTLVISAGLAPTGFFAGCAAGGCDDDVYYRNMAAAGAAQYMDCVGAHYNEGVVPPTVNSSDPRDPRNPYPTQYLQANTDRAWVPFGGAVPVCYTELGYLTNEGYPDITPLPENFFWAENVTIEEQAQWLGDAALISAESGKVRLMIIWNMDYANNQEFDPIAGYAIIRADGSCPACDTLGSIPRQ